MGIFKARPDGSVAEAGVVGGGTGDVAEAGVLGGGTGDVAEAGVAVTGDIAVESGDWGVCLGEYMEFVAAPSGEDAIREEVCELNSEGRLTTRVRSSLSILESNTPV